MESKLTGTHRRTYDKIFQHPVARNLDWREVKSMLSALGRVVDEPNGNFKVEHNGQTLVVRPASSKDVADVAHLMQIRHFLERSAKALSPPRVAGTHMLVVIDHRQARIYKTEVHGSVPRRIVPYDPGGLGRHLHNVEDDSNGQRKPERRSFYQAVIQAIHDAEKVLVFGSGTGASSAMDQLIAELRQHHKELADRIVGSIVLDEQHLTENQLLARAREFYSNAVS